MAISKQYFHPDNTEDDEDFVVPSLHEAEEGPALVDEPVVEDLEDGSSVYDFSGAGVPEGSFPSGHYDNLAESVGKETLKKIGSDIKNLFTTDLNSRKEWVKTYASGLRWLGFTRESKTEPWDGACEVTHPLLAEAVVRFQSNSISEIFPADGPTKVKIPGSNTEEVLQRANRIKDYLNFLLTEKMKDYRDEYEKLLFGLPISGSAFKKVYFDTDANCPVSEYVPAEDLVVNYGAKNLEKASRISHLLSITENDFIKMKLNGFYSNIDIGTPSVYISDIQEVKDKLIGIKEMSTDSGNFRFIEMHCNLDLEGFEHTDDSGEETGLGLPYVVTVDFATAKVLSIRRNWVEEDLKYNKRSHFVHYQYVPGTGFYAFGLTHLIGGIAESSTSILRQLIDSGTIANVPGGFRRKGLRIDGGSQPIAPGEWREIDTQGMSLSDSFFPLPYNGASAVLFQLMQSIVEDGRRFASLNDIQASEMNAQAPVGTTLAILERTMKVMSAIHSRLHASARKEFKLIADLIRGSDITSYPYNMDQYTDKLKEDFASELDILPVSDPNASTMAQRIMTHQAAFQNMQLSPEIYDKKHLHRTFLMAINMKDVDSIIPPDATIPVMDPVTENVSVLMGKPIRTFDWQDHEAHITAHMAALQDPKLVGLLGQSPGAQALQAQMEAHIQEHVAYAYRSQIEKVMGFKMPALNEDMPQDSEIQFSRVVSEAAKKLTAQSIAEQKKEEAKNIMEDPNWQLRKQELDIKQRSAEAKAQNDSVKMQLSAIKDIGSLNNQEQDRMVELLKIILDAEANKESITNKASQDKLSASIQLLQTVLNSAKEADQMAMNLLQGQQGKNRNELN